MSGSAILLESTVEGIQKLTGQTNPDIVASSLEARRWYWRELRGYSEQRISASHFVYRQSNGRIWVELFVKQFNQRQIHRREAMEAQRSTPMETAL